mmetsp:Transcript_41425/g.86947  ORF Transcript_41425/g.86947 Transcript_41425/m.86947 type:complete len:326 (+) Transcript_41425:179-1156(+)
MSGSEASFNEVEAAEQELVESLRKMGKVVNNLIARADCIPFREPVDWKGLGLYDYPKIITKMMDLGTIKKKLEKKKYADASQCADDIRLVWKNCMTYNADGSDFYRLAESYSTRFEERYQKLVDEFGEDVICGNIGGGGRTTGSSRRADRSGNNQKSSSGGRKSRSNSFASTGNGRNTPISNLDKASSHSASKAENASSSGYDTTKIVPLDVRARFASRLSRLSGMELGHVLQVIDSSCPEVLEDPTPDRLRSDATPVIRHHNYGWDEFDGGCQIEVDVDAIPPETFWKLDGYVKEKVQGRGRGPWSDDLTEPEPVGKKRKMKSL